MDTNIKYHISAEFADDLQMSHGGYSPPVNSLMKKYVVLVEEHELSAIKLSVDGIEVVGNRPFINFKNTLRGLFIWKK